MPVLQDNDSRLTTIRALLAKAEATTFAAEAEAFTAKASELMARYALDEAMVWASSPNDGGVPAERRITVYRPFTAQKAILVNAVAEALGCKAIRLGRVEGGAADAISIIGFPSDLTLVDTLITSLFLQLTTAMTAPEAQRSGTAAQVASWRRSFIMGFAHTISTRLEADRKQAAAEADRARTAAGDAAPRSTALVLRDRSAAVTDDYRRRYPYVRTSRVSAGTSEAGRRAGASAGSRADIGAKHLGKRRALQRGG